MILTIPNQKMLVRKTISQVNSSSVKNKAMTRAFLVSMRNYLTMCEDMVISDACPSFAGQKFLDTISSSDPASDLVKDAGDLKNHRFWTMLTKPGSLHPLMKVVHEVAMGNYNFSINFSACFLWYTYVTFMFQLSQGTANSIRPVSTLTSIVKLLMETTLLLSDRLEYHPEEPRVDLFASSSKTRQILEFNKKLLAK